MAMSTAWLNRSLNGLYKILAISLVLLAVLLSAIRLFLPYAANYQQELQGYLNRSYQAHIELGTLTTGWRGLGPTLVAKNISVVRSDAIDIFIQRVDFNINVLQSIQQFKLVTDDFTLQGAKIFVDKSAFKQGKGLGDNAQVLTSLGDLFFNQINRFTITDSQLVVKKKKRNRTIYIDNLQWLNQDERHRAKGEVIFDGISSNNIKLLLDINGSQFDQAQGTLYLSANNADISPLLSQLINSKTQISQTDFNFDAWLNIEQGQLINALVSLGRNQISWQLGDSKHKAVFAPSAIEFSGNIDENDFKVNSQPIAIQVDQQHWQPVTLQALVAGDNAQLYVSNAEIASLLKLAPSFLDTTDWLTKTAPSGILQDIYLRKLDDNWQFSTQFSQLAISGYQGLPSVKDLSGNLLIANNQAQLLLRAENGALNFGDAFVEPIEYQQLKLTLNAQWQQDNWHFSSPDLRFVNQDLSLTGQIAVSGGVNQQTKMSLLASLSNLDASLAYKYYPINLMGKDLVNYLNNSIKAGKVTQANVLVNGALTDFPFTDHNGIFVVDAELEDASFQFDPHWPAIEKFAANLNFTNNSMLITARAGELTQLSVAGVTAAIDDLSNEQILVVHAPIAQADPNAVRSLMLQSPLAETVGATLKRVQIQQPIDGSLALTVPLNDADNTVAKGTVKFIDNAINLSTPQMYFTQVNGEIAFENESISSNKVQLNWQGLPIELVAKANDTKDYYSTEIALTGQWQQAAWQSFVPEKLRSYVNGELAWQGKLELFMPHQADFSYRLTLNSNLAQLALALPEPYQKPFEQITPLQVMVNGRAEQSTIDASYGEKLNFFGVLNHHTTSFERAHLLFGDEQMMLPRKGFHISANLAQIDYAPWQSFLVDIIDSLPTTSTTSKQPPLLSRPQRIQGTIGKLGLLGKNLTGVSFNLFDKPHWWLLQLNAKEVRAQLKFYPDWYQQGIDINADFVHWPIDELITQNQLSTSSEVQQSKPIVEQTQTSTEQLAQNMKLYQQIPPIQFHSDKVSLGKIDLGKVDFQLTRNDTGQIELKHFVAQKGKSKLQLEGQWSHVPDGDQTVLQGNLLINDVAHELESLGYASVVRESGAKFEFNMSWPKAPYEFELSNVNGDIKARLDDGYLADVSDKGARIFSILSLGSLVRKLKLDFRDIFSDGMFYSKITGDFHLADGVLYTDNTKMNGSAGDLTIKGNTKLSQGVLDYRMAYKPNLTSSLPVLAWIATLNPVGIIAGAALDKVFTAKVVSEFNFELTGDVNDPQLKQVTKKTRDIRVGRSTPPEFVDNNEITEQAQEQPKAPSIKPEQKGKSNG